MPSPLPELDAASAALRSVMDRCRLPPLQPGPVTVLLCVEADDYTAPIGFCPWTGTLVSFPSIYAACACPPGVREGQTYLVDANRTVVASMLHQVTLPATILNYFARRSRPLIPADTLATLRADLHLPDRAERAS